jgi:hypothetical protein
MKSAVKFGVGDASAVGEDSAVGVAAGVSVGAGVAVTAVVAVGAGVGVGSSPNIPQASAGKIKSRIINLWNRLFFMVSNLLVLISKGD